METPEYSVEKMETVEEGARTTEIQYDVETQGVVTDFEKINMEVKPLKVTINRQGIGRTLSISDGKIKFTVYNCAKFAKFL